MANEGIWRLILTTRNEIPAAVEKDIQALNRLEAKAKASQGGLAKVLGKAMPGGAVGNAAGNAMGGGIGASVATGVAFASLAAMQNMVEQAMELDANSKRSEAAMKALTRSTDETVSALSQFGMILETLKMTVQAMGSSNLARNVNAGRLGVGAVFDTLMTNPAAQGLMGLMQRMFPGSASALTAFMSDQSARGLAGLQGDDLGTQAAGRAQTRLEEALKKRREQQPSESSRSFSRAPMTFAADEYARMGLFIGGASATKETNALLRDHKEQLQLLNRTVDQLAPRIASEL